MNGPGAGSDVVAGRYALVDPIASGGSGTVWRAYDHDRDQWCAAKVMRQRHAGEVLRFAREQAVRLHHPHIASPYAWAADDGTVLIASELVDGGSLHTLLGDWGPFDEPTVVVLLDQLLSALGAMHDAGLVHRDVKPGNVLLRATGDGPLHCMLTDFGLTIGTNEPRLTQTGMVIGTPGYLPPEVMSGRTRPYPSQDVYAAGRLALTLALGHDARPETAPWPGSDDTAASQAGDDERLEHILDPQLQAALRLMTEADPARRPADAHQAASLLVGLPRSATPRTVGGDDVSVLHQLPGASSASPAPLAAVGPDPDAREDGAANEGAANEGAADEGAAHDGEDAFATRVRGRATRSQPPPTAPFPASPSVAGEGGASDVSPVNETTGPARTRPGWRRSRALTSAAAAVVALAAGTAVAAGAGWGPFDSTPVTTDPSTGPGTVSVPVEGEPCGWQQQGDVADTTDGRLVCRLADGAYVWGP